MGIPPTIEKRVKNELIQFCNNLPVNPAELYEPIRYTLKLGGKNVRPHLMLLTCKMLKGNIHEAIHTAIAIELFHNFTLIHDDIADNSPLRRNHATVHIKWNSNIALLSGDALLIKAYQELNKTLPDKLSLVLQLFNAAALKVCEGQQLDMNYERKKNVSLNEYLNMISLKTAALFGLSMQLGAVHGGTTVETRKDMYAVGENLGMLFQLKDDVLDVFGKKDKTGKQTGGDIIQNKKTFLLLKALELAKGKTKSELNMLLTNTKISASEKVNGVKKIYKDLGVEEHANNQMKTYFNKIEKALSTIKTPEKDVLIELVSSLLERDS